MMKEIAVNLHPNDRQNRRKHAKMERRAKCFHCTFGSSECACAKEARKPRLIAVNSVYARRREIGFPAPQKAAGARLHAEFFVIPKPDNVTHWFKQWPANDSHRIVGFPYRDAAGFQRAHIQSVRLERIKKSRA